MGERERKQRCDFSFPVKRAAFDLKDAVFMSSATRSTTAACNSACLAGIGDPKCQTPVLEMQEKRPGLRWTGNKICLPE